MLLTKSCNDKQQFIIIIKTGSASLFCPLRYNGNEIIMQKKNDTNQTRDLPISLLKYYQTSWIRFLFCMRHYEDKKFILSNDYK